MKLTKKLREQVLAIYKKVYSPKHLEAIERYIVYLATISFLVHIGLIFSCNFENFIWLRKICGTNYLAAISTPFSILLFFEIFLFILSIPESISKSIGRQYEIASLVVIRNVFKDLGHLENLSDLAVQSEIFKILLIDMSGAIVMFFLVAVFYHLRNKCYLEQHGDACPISLVNFVALKKFLSLMLTVVFLGLIGYSIFSGLIGLFAEKALGNQFLLSNGWFFKELFSIMVFSNVFILLLSYLYTSDYEVMFRNSGFVVSMIFILISINIPHEYSVLLALIGMLFGVLIMIVYNYFRSIHVATYHRK